MLGPLQDNGGQVWTHALLPGSPAIDAGDNPRSLWTDARQYACSDSGCVQYERTLGAGTDIGAFELGGPDRIFDDGFDREARAADGPGPRRDGDALPGWMEPASAAPYQLQHA